ncbi:hypothetical protein F5141DRAFT_985539, partial [Pisolithus sp. B1]
ELGDLSVGIDEEDCITLAMDRLKESVKVQDDNEEGWVDEITTLADDKHAEIKGDILPVKLALVKLHHLAFKVIHSLTAHLPARKKTPEDHKMLITIIPHDMLTHWNSLYNMIQYCIEHHTPIEAI